MVAPRPRKTSPLSANQRPKGAGTGETGESAYPATGMPNPEYAEKLKLARHLHDQGINPLAWTRAQPAPFADQDQFRRTGRKPRDTQFEVGGRLYDTTPEIAATPAQGRAALAAYLKEIGDPDTRETPPLESYVEIDKVPLRHPLGQKATFAETPQDSAALHRLIRAGIDPRRAHLGDPLPAPLQQRLQGGAATAETLENDAANNDAAADTSDLVYRSADGWIYAKNDATREPDEVARIRARHAERRAAASAAPVNDNDEIAEIAQFYAPDLEAPPETAADNREQSAPAPAATNSIDDEHRYNAQAATRLAGIAAEMPHILAAVEKAKAGEGLSEEEQRSLTELRAKFSAIGLTLDPAESNLDQLRVVATAIANAQAALETKQAQGEAIDADTSLGRAPLHVATQSLNTELAQALLGSTAAWAQVAQNGPGQALVSALMASKRYGRFARPAALLAGGTTASLNAAQIAREWAEQEGSPDIFSPYSESPSSADGHTVPRTNRPLPRLQSRLTVADIDAIEQIFGETETSFNRAQPLSVTETQFADILREGEIEGIEIFGFPMATPDPRGNEQTQGRVDKLKQMALKKLEECGAKLVEEWGGKDRENPGERKKERHVPPGKRGTKGARKSDLGFKIRWRGNYYILDINTVDILKSGMMTAREALALKCLRANRLTRLALKGSSDDYSSLDEFEGKVGAFKKGKDMSDEEWEKEAQAWIDDFIDCDGPLDVKISDDADADE